MYLRNHWHLVADGRALELDEVVVRAVGREERAGVLEVLELRIALERLLACVVVPCAQKNPSVGCGIAVS